MKRHILRSIPFFLILILLPAQAQGSKPEKSKLDLNQQYLLLATSKTSTMQKELNEASAVGYRVVVGGRTGGANSQCFWRKWLNLRRSTSMYYSPPNSHPLCKKNLMRLPPRASASSLSQ